ncbi:MAG TPA: TIGR02757 family protein [Bacteroidales bacterium]
MDFQPYSPGQGNDVLFDFLEEKADQYNNPIFIESDPISIPHLFQRKEDIEIAAFFAATIAWGQRPTIIRNAQRLMHLMDDSPYEFITGTVPSDLTRFSSFVHRTFKGEDVMFFVHSLQNIYRNHGGLETVFNHTLNEPGADAKDGLQYFRQVFFSIPFPNRTRRHVADVIAGSAAKRLNMFLRWMVRNDKRGVDFGIWKGIGMNKLYCPLDVHSGQVARKLGLLSRTQNDWKAVEELTAALRTFDPDDPVKYDFALFGLGVFEKF